MRSIALLFMAACLTVAFAAERFKVSFPYPAYVGETQLKQGQCRLTLDGETAIFEQGRQRIEVPVKVETVENKYRRTTVRYRVEGDKYTISEIGLGGTNRKLVFPSS